MQLPNPEISEALREVSNRIVIEREKCLEIARRPQGHGANAQRIYGNQAVGLYRALDIIKEVLQQTEKKEEQ